ncbi:MAG: cell division protein ZapA [Lachnospiraceae bacterium]|nr:cell division protein ZapA [Lachnospiraceae bacterium]
MASKNTVEVLIAGKIMRISGYESEDYLQRVAAYLSHKTTELRELRGYNHMSSELRGQLLSLNIADDYFKAKERADRSEESLQEKDSEIYDLKHEIVELKVQLEKAKKQQTQNGPRR